MKFCTKCGTQLEDDGRFCPSCGNPVDGEKRRENDEPQSKQQSNDHGAAQGLDDNQKDVQENKVLAVLSYFFCLWFIPLIAAKESKFARFHAIQGFNIFLLWLIEIVVYAIVNAIAWATLSVGAIMGVSVIFTIISILIVVLEIIGIVNAIKGDAKEVPLVGKWRIIK